MAHQPAVTVAQVEKIPQGYRDAVYADSIHADKPESFYTWVRKAVVNVEVRALALALALGGLHPPTPDG